MHFSLKIVREIKHLFLIGKVNDITVLSLTAVILIQFLWNEIRLN